MKLLKSVLTAAPLLLALATGAAAQSPPGPAPQQAGAAAAEAEVVFERGSVLAHHGDIVNRTISFIIEKGIGKVSEAVIEHRGTSTLRVHFKVQAAPAQPTWGLVMLDGNRQPVWSYSSAGASGGDFWSDELKGDTFTVEVYSIEPNTPLQITVDKLGVAGPVVTGEAITDPNNLSPIVDQSPAIKAVARATARLRFEGDDGDRYYCTGFLVGPDLLLTNQHCPISQAERDSTLVDFDFDSGTTPTTPSLKLKERLVVNYDLDFALYRLSGKPAGRQPLRLDERPPTRDTELHVIQHPSGEAKQISLLQCFVTDPELLGRKPQQPVPLASRRKTDFGHFCDTKKGSSGASVVSMQTGGVVGIHHLGFKENDSILVNRAVLMRFIADTIRNEKPAVAAEMGIARN